jgi:hypothetical protein
MTTPSLSATEIRDLLLHHRLQAGTEALLQAGIEEVLQNAQVPFLREHRLSPQDRPDFMVGGVAIEVKIDQGWRAVLRQLSRYAAHPEVKEILLVTARMQHGAVPESIQGKPIVTCVLLVGLL